MLIDFLKTTRTKEELSLALDILKEFKNNESQNEWLNFPFESWARLEQLEDYIKILTDIDLDSVDDIHAKEYFKSIKHD